MRVRADMGPATHVDRYSCQSLVEPTEALPGFVSHESRQSTRMGSEIHAPNALAANWAPAIADTALMSALTKPSTEEKLPPPSMVNTSSMLAHSCAPAGVESVVHATS